MRAIAVSLATILLLLNGPLFAQGSLEPDAPPGPTMKTLDQVEPRMPVPGPGPLTISSPGSYFLTQDTSGSIAIDADNVTLDLNGFTVSGGNPSIAIGGQTNVRIFNGRVQNGSNVGISATSSNLVFIHDIQMTDFFTCIAAVQISGYVEIARVNCDTTQAEGFRLISDFEQVGVFHVSDCTLRNINLNTMDPRPAVSIRHLGTGGSISAMITGNRIFNANDLGFFTLSTTAATAGIIADNYVINAAGTAFDISGDFVVTRNVASSNATAYDLASAPNAAGVVAIADDPRPWSNVSD